MKRLDPSLPFYYHTRIGRHLMRNVEHRKEIREHNVEQMSRMQGLPRIKINPGSRSIGAHTITSLFIDHPPPPSGVNPLSEPLVNKLN